MSWCFSTSWQRRTNAGPNFQLLADIASEAFVPLGYGGGVRTIDAVGQLFTLGFEKVVINTYAVENPSFIKTAASRFGSQSIVVSIDAPETPAGRLRGVLYPRWRRTHAP